VGNGWEVRNVQLAEVPERRAAGMRIACVCGWWEQVGALAFISTPSFLNFFFFGGGSIADRI
jgi:hypothetical protein